MAHPAGEAPASFFCSLSLELFDQPVTTSDGHCYERSFIERWLGSNDTSPVTGAVLPHKELVPAYALRNAILEWQRLYAKQINRADLELHELVGTGSFKQARTPAPRAALRRWCGVLLVTYPPPTYWPLRPRHSLTSHHTRTHTDSCEQR